MKIKLSQKIWEKMGKTAGWWDAKNISSSNPSAKSGKEIDFEVYNKWKQFQLEELEPAMEKAIFNMQQAITDGDKEAYEMAESKFDWASSNNIRAKSEIQRLKDKHGF